jgi:DinB family protein
MKSLAEELRSEIDASHARLRELTEADVTPSRAEGKWSRKEVLGHLIDSAANNHQRFVRAQLVDAFTWPGYEQNDWVHVHRYRDEPWVELLTLWLALNCHVARVIESVPDSKVNTRCIIGSGEPVTLEWLMRDYLRHLRHHVAQILEPAR